MPGSTNGHVTGSIVQLRETRPGELIAAEDWNAVIRVLNHLQERVALIESSSGAVNVLISSVIPVAGANAPIRVNDDVQILGANFKYSLGQQRVFFDGVRTDTYLPGSSDSRLIVRVPRLIVPLAGKSVVLRVENGSSADEVNITVLPILQGLQGDITVNWADGADNPNPNPIKANEPALFKFTFRSDANQVASYTLIPSIVLASNPLETEPFGRLEVLDSEQRAITNRQLRVEAGATLPFFVRARTVSAADSESFTLNVTASAQDLSATAARTLIVGTPIQPSNPKYDVDSPSATPTGVLVGRTLSLKAGQLGILSFQVRFKEAGNYEVFAELVGANNWQARPLPTAPQPYIEAGPATEDIQFRVQPETGASATGKLICRFKEKDVALEHVEEFNLNLVN